MLVANLYEYLHGENKRLKAEYPLATHLEKYHEWKNNSGRRNPGATAKLLEKSANAAQQRWTESFELLSSCPEFHGAWDLFLVLRQDINDTAQGASALVASLSGSDKEESNQGIKRIASNIDESDCHHLKTALRNLEAGLRRRDESFVEIPSLQTLFSSSNEDNVAGSNLFGALSNFWPLFHIASTDIRMAYFRLLELWETCETSKTRSSVTLDEVRLVNRTMLAALERIRNCLALLKKTGEQLAKPQQNDAHEEKEKIGNTVISPEDRNILVTEAKILEGADTSNVAGNSEKLYLKVLPSNFGVMIRDIHTACTALEQIIENCEKRKNEAKK